MVLAHKYTFHNKQKNALQCLDRNPCNMAKNKNKNKNKAIGCISMFIHARIFHAYKHRFYRDDVSIHKYMRIYI